MMDWKTTVILSLTVYKICSLAVGTVLGYFGYQLFMHGVWGDAGSFTASHRNMKLLLKGAAPGTFFIVFGAAVIGFTVFKGFDVGSSITGPAPPLP
jgi:hypothetical protein